MRTSSAKVPILVLGAVLGLIAFGLVAAGSVLGLTHAVLRDDDGFYRTPVERFTSDGVAVVADLDDLADLPVRAEERRVGRWDVATDARLRARDAGEAAVFVGVGPTSAVRAYLAGAAWDQVRDVEYRPFRVLAIPHEGTGAVDPPADQSFWVASTAGRGRVELHWAPEVGDWSAVVMNADGSAGVAADVSAGLKANLFPLAALLLGAGGLVGLGALGLIAGGLRAQGPDTSGPPPSAARSAAAAGSGPYPARLEARLDEPLSRGLWLVKWLLVLPHLVVLAFLWMAFSVLTLVAGASILFTGRYPRTIFDFNVGVLRWTWRVQYYAFVLGTDRYPPFSLAPDPTYPCSFDVAYPVRLSRGLVLVKWWLLALPHLLILSIFGYGVAQPFLDDDPRPIGLVGLLVLIAAVGLLFGGRYSRSLYDLVLGMMRWTYRVYAYVALLRDEYPPFRLDTGGDEPGDPPPAGPPEPDHEEVRKLVNA